MRASAKAFQPPSCGVGVASTLPSFFLGQADVPAAQSNNTNVFCMCYRHLGNIDRKKTSHEMCPFADPLATRRTRVFFFFLVIKIL